MAVEKVNIENIALTKEIFGNLDKNTKRVEEEFGVNISLDEGNIKIVGESVSSKAAADVLKNLEKALIEKGRLEDQDLNYYISMVKKGKTDIASSLLQDIICLNSYGKPIRPKTIGQKVYLDSIDNNGIVFGIGPAGTGKTYLAMAKAVTAFKNKEVNRIVLTRPAVEAGESLGFLPGDLNEKIDPYLRPLYDALFDIMGYENYLKLKEKNLIEVAPLAYMRGRTLESSFVILDEAQNTTNQQMKMFLTRLGFGSKAIITGDVTQVDLPRGKKSGLLTVKKILAGIKGISFSYLTRDDIVRHPLVQKIIDAYEKFEEEND
ncbi:PhoH family protein [Citroniella saccharovorans]|uniref:PhoH-like protein n=1 Tax=Citroniella saccharovorans TaxID=2053367 RepID=A0AAW9MSM9_9FIRM|nr:PhoH family protein [Citroniella saccharovorans]MEB3430116.1 PhoH family protein [Citroniella saccharovorans]